MLSSAKFIHSWMFGQKSPDTVSSASQEDDTRPWKPDMSKEALAQKASRPLLKVCIIGAGMAGLFSAMIFDFLNDTYDFNVEYEILEAEESRSGGRLYTYTFPEKDGHPAIGPHDYYDVGAMRFPQVKCMDRLFQLFKRLDMNMVDPKKCTPRKGDLIPSRGVGVNMPYLFNGVQIVPHGGKPVLSAKAFNVPGIPRDIAERPLHDLVEDCIVDLKEIYKHRGFQSFLDKLLRDVDPYSVRQYLTTQIGHYNYNTLEFLETFSFGNRWFDQAATEMVLESIKFDRCASWVCIEGGSSQLSERTKLALRNQKAVKFGKTVTEVNYSRPHGSSRLQVDVSVRCESSPRTYDAVFNSAPLGAMQQMRLEGVGMDWKKRTAIRNLGYAASCKIAVRFRTLWWMRNGLNITQGGQAKCDLPIRSCVYPSYNIHDDPNQPGVLLASYTYTQEAERMGALFASDSEKDKLALKELIVDNLAKLHAKTGDSADYERLRRIIDDNWLDCHAYNWCSNPFAAGAFAYFGPGQFSNLYSSLVHSDGKHIIIGEAASTNHAWVSGALESAVRGVYQFCRAHGDDEAAAAIVRDYHEDKIPGPFGPLPAEFGEVPELSR